MEGELKKHTVLEAGKRSLNLAGWSPFPGWAGTKGHLEWDGEGIREEDLEPGRRDSSWNALLGTENVLVSCGCCNK